MYVGLKFIDTDYLRSTDKLIHQFYKIIDDTGFEYQFTTATPIVNGIPDDIYTANQMLNEIYKAYKYSNLSLCKNFKLVLQKTFSLNMPTVMLTNFYKEHKNFIDKLSHERKLNA